MNNFDTQEKIESIDTAIETLLENHKIDWKNERLYSWGYTTGVSDLDATTVYGKYGNGDFKIKNVKNDSFGDSVSSKFIEVSKPLLKLGAKTEFVLELKLVLFTNTAPYHVVVSNMEPNQRAFNDQKFHSDIGKWYTGLR